MTHNVMAISARIIIAYLQDIMALKSQLALLVFTLLIVLETFFVTVVNVKAPLIARVATVQMACAHGEALKVLMMAVATLLVFLLHLAIDATAILVLRTAIANMVHVQTKYVLLNYHNKIMKKKKILQQINICLGMLLDFTSWVVLGYLN